MKLTPQQVLLSSLLQLPVLALEQKIKQEMELNPLLEETQELEEDLDLDIETEETQEQIQETPDEISENNADEKPAETVKSEDNEIDWGEVLNDDKHFEARAPRDLSRDDETDWTPPSKISLAEHLLDQLRFTRLTADEQAIGEYIIWNINEEGYLIYNGQNPVYDEIASFESTSSDANPQGLETFTDSGLTEASPGHVQGIVSSGENDPVLVIARELQTSPVLIRKVLEVIQQFDPPGIAARNLQECLLIQLRQKSKGYYDNITVVSLRIIEEAYDDFIHRKYDRVQKKLSISADDLKPAIMEILALNPKPGEGYIVPEQNFVVPDLIVRRLKDEFEIMLNDHTVPNLRINNVYKRMMQARSKSDKEAKEFLKNKLESAKWLINSLYRRRDTLRRTMQAIVDIQIDFFRNGPGYLKPMILEDVAKIIQMDISTVSRATNGKYVQTDYGVLELKYFFSTSLTSSDGDDVSTRKIKDALKSVIDGEDKSNPLSDEELTKVLAEKGFPVARRTVAKYREQMRIPAARFRKAI